MVSAQRNIKSDELSDAPPLAFENLRMEILGYSTDGESLVTDPRYQNGLFVVITDSRTSKPTSPQTSGRVTPYVLSRPILALCVLLFEADHQIRPVP